MFTRNLLIFTVILSICLLCLVGCGSSSGSDVYAVGDKGTILHWNGSSWSNQTVSGVVHSLRSVWGSSITNIYAVGSEGIILHYK